jgi:hypothetical protein
MPLFQKLKQTLQPPLIVAGVCAVALVLLIVLGAKVGLFAQLIRSGWLP